MLIVRDSYQYTRETRNGYAVVAGKPVSGIQLAEPGCKSERCIGFDPK